MLGGQSRKALRPDTARHIGLGTSNLDTDISSITSGRLINIQIVPGHQNPVDQYTLSNPVDVARNLARMPSDPLLGDGDKRPRSHPIVGNLVSPRLG